MSKTDTATKPDEQTKTNEPMTKAQVKVVAGLPTVSARIRYLDSQGYTRSQITKLITNGSGGVLRYQHVRNVLITPITKAKAKA